MSLRTRRAAICVGLPIGLALAVAGTIGLRGPAIIESARSRVAAARAAVADATAGPRAPTDPAPSPNSSAGDKKPDLDAISKYGAWVGAGGLTDLNAFAEDAKAVSQAADQNDAASALRACAAMTPHLRTAQSHPLFPDQQARDAWASALRHLGSATVYCQKAKARNGNVALLNQMGKEINNAEADLRRFGDLVDAYRAKAN